MKSKKELSLMKSFFNVKFLLLVLVASCSLCPPPALAQTITINTPLDFGRFVLVDNAAPRNIALLPGGGFTADSEYLFFIDPQMGNLTVDGYAPFTPLTITVGTASLNPVGAGTADFVTSSTFTDPAVVVTDASGEVTFDVGATLSSDGGGTTHTDVTYNGMFTVNVAP